MYVTPRSGPRLQLAPGRWDSQRLHGSYAMCWVRPFVFVTDSDTPPTNNESDFTLQSGVIFRYVTHGPRSQGAWTS